MNRTLPPLVEQSSITNPIARTALMVAGAVLTSIGLVLWILPGLPGIPLLVLGLGALAASSRHVAGAVNWLDRHLPDRVRHLLRLSRQRQDARSSVDRFFDNP